MEAVGKKSRSAIDIATILIRVELIQALNFGLGFLYRWHNFLYEDCLLW